MVILLKILVLFSKIYIKVEGFTFLCLFITNILSAEKILGSKDFAKAN